MIKYFEEFSKDNLITLHNFQDCIRKAKGPELYMKLVVEAPGLRHIGVADTGPKENLPGGGVFWILFRKKTAEGILGENQTSRISANGGCSNSSPCI